jgi:hypothetical protein
MNSGADTPALNRRITAAVVASNQQQDPISATDCMLEGAIDRPPGRVEVHAVEVEHAVRLDITAPQPFVPAAVKRALGDRIRFRRNCRHLPQGWRAAPRLNDDFARFFRDRRRRRLVSR